MNEFEDLIQSNVFQFVLDKKTTKALFGRNISVTYKDMTVKHRVNEKKENIDLSWIWEVCWMRNRVKKFKISVPSIIKTAMVFPMICGVFFCVPAYALDSDLSYNYKTENQEEFVIVGNPISIFRERYQIISGTYTMYRRRQFMIQSMVPM